MKNIFNMDGPTPDVGTNIPDSTSSDLGEKDEIIRWRKILWNFIERYDSLYRPLMKDYDALIDRGYELNPPMLEDGPRNQVILCKPDGQMDNSFASSGVSILRKVISLRTKGDESHLGVYQDMRKVRYIVLRNAFII